MANYNRTHLINFRIWYEYEILMWPPKLIGKKYDMPSSRVCRIVREKGDSFRDMPLPNEWKDEPKWDREAFLKEEIDAI